MEKITISIKNSGTQPLPEYQTELASGMDVRANISDSIFLKPMERILVPTGLFLAIPKGYEVQVRPRSGLALKQGITCLNTPGTIDADYRGELKVLLINLSNEIQSINSGDRIAQLVVAPVVQAEWNIVAELDETKRGIGGFGHSGKN